MPQRAGCAAPSAARSRGTPLGVQAAVGSGLLALPAAGARALQGSLTSGSGPRPPRTRRPTENVVGALEEGARARPTRLLLVESRSRPVRARSSHRLATHALPCQRHARKPVIGWERPAPANGGLKGRAAGGPGRAGVGAPPPPCHPAPKLQATDVACAWKTGDSVGRGEPRKSIATPAIVPPQAAPAPRSGGPQERGKQARQGRRPRRHTPRSAGPPECPALAGPQELRCKARQRGVAQTRQPEG